MNTSLRFFPLSVLLVVAVLFLNGVSEWTALQELKNTAKNYEIRALKIPPYLNLAGERVPLERSDVRERMDKELLVNTYWQSNGLLLIKKANKYFPLIEPLLEKYGIPDDFKYLAVAESGLENVSSPAKACGFWQFLRTSGREYGLEINTNVDERYHLEKATQVAAAYLKKSKERFGSWTLAAAAYNAGNASIAKKLKTQQVDNYYDLLLNEETSRYVYRIIALKEILSNPEKYGFLYDDDDMYTIEASRIVKVDTPITNIASFAKSFGTTYKQLKLHNPWLRENKLHNKTKKMYEIKIPVQ